MDVDKFYRESLDHENVQVKSFDEHPEEIGADKVCQENS